MAFAYSDGDVEVAVKTLVEQHDPVPSIQRFSLPGGEDWPHRYHLSPVRGNLLRHFNFTGLDVIELGAGMGAISRYLAEHCQWLTAVEGSQRRFDTLAARLRDLRNWDGYVANLEEVKATRKYDVVCVVGVMEYAELYTTMPESGSPTAAAWFLARAVRHLKDDGALIIAIENKLGLKYWRGAAEDHLGRLYSGITDYSFTPSPRTYSRNELLELLHGAGLLNVAEYYPYPDYKLPHTVLTSEFVQQWPELSADITASKFYEGSDFPNLQLFPETLASRSVARAGLLPEMSNSFLFAASRTGDSTILAKLQSRAGRQRQLAWHYATEKPDPVVTVFSLNDNEQLRAHKELLSDGSRPRDKSLTSSDDLNLHWHAVDDLIIMDAQPLRAILLSHAYNAKWDAWWDELLAFFRWSLVEWGVSGDHGSHSSPLLSGRALDASVFNSLVPDALSRRAPGDSPHRYKVFDLEYTSDRPIPMTWFMLRNVYTYDQLRSPLIQTVPTETLRQVYEKSCEALNLLCRYEDDVEREAKFTSMAWSVSIDQARRDVRATMEGPQFDSPAPRGPYAVLDVYNGYTASTREIELEAEIDHLNQILSSRTHKLAARVCEALIKARKLVGK